MDANGHLLGFVRSESVPEPQKLALFEAVGRAVIDRCVYIHTPFVYACLSKCIRIGALIDRCVYTYAICSFLNVIESMTAIRLLDHSPIVHTYAAAGAKGTRSPGPFGSRRAGSGWWLQEEEDRPKYFTWRPFVQQGGGGQRGAGGKSGQQYG